MHHSKGSLWRKWDLHFHTPSSFDYKDKSITNEQIIDGLVRHNIRLVAITDHHIMDVNRIRALQKLGKGKITVLPGIELRSELGGSETVHFIGIFSESCDLEYIWEKIENKLNLTKKDIEAKGGDESIYVSIREAAKLIHEYDGLISIHAGHKSNSIENITNKTLFQQAVKKDLLKGDVLLKDRAIVDILEIGKPDDTNDYETIVFPKIQEYLPLIICSDNHRITDYQTKTSCWFRADPNFYGLQQVLVEPQDRIYIGEKPEKRISVSKHRTRYIQNITIQKRLGNAPTDVWFDDISVDLNHDLIAIIGNKGTGKSALAEIIGLLGNTHNREKFSFLSPGRFLNPQKKLAEHFIAKITWENGYSPRSFSLDEDTDINAPEQVKCIPQGLFEDICNEIASGKDSKFNQELHKVIFSHVPEADQLGKDSLDTLIEHLTNEIDDAIEILKAQLREKNQEIANIEEKLTSAHKKRLTNQLKEKHSELSTHERSKPNEVDKPRESNERDQDISSQIAALEQKREDLKLRLENAQKQESRSAQLMTNASKVLSTLTNFETQYQEFQKQVAPELAQFGIKFDSIVKLTVNRQPLEQVQEMYREERQISAKLIDPNVPDSLSCQIDEANRKLDFLQDQLDEPNRLYEAYRTELAEWNEHKKQIIGAKDKVGTLTYLEDQLVRLDKLPEILQDLKDSRIKLTKQIYNQIERLVDVYRHLYAPVQQFSTSNDVSEDAFDLKFDVSIVDQGLEKDFFYWIGRNIIGSFYGSEKGEKELKKVVERHDFNEWSGVEAFLNDLIDHLTHDKRHPNNPIVSITEQLRQQRDLNSFYDFIFSLDYLRPRYVLKLDGKELSQLSPGERGALLLIFYLLIDKAEIPLIIDQPEENLDNQTVYKQLVNAIKKAKNHRQIIIVTHNPNLAVVCDAEQIVCCSIDKKDGYRIEYYTGAIENPEVNRRIVDILEGTKPALANRWRKYAPFREI